MTNRLKFDLGRFWALKTISGTRRDALGTGPGRQKAAPGPILGRPGRAKIAGEPAKRRPGPVPGRSRTTPERCPSAFGTRGTFECARGTIFRRFCVVARVLRCASRYSFNGVLLTSDEVSTDCARTPQKLKNRPVSASKIVLGTLGGASSSAKTAKSIEKVRSKRLWGLRFFF